MYIASRHADDPANTAMNHPNAISPSADERTDISADPIGQGRFVWMYSRGPARARLLDIDEARRATEYSNFFMMANTEKRREIIADMKQIMSAAIRKARCVNSFLLSWDCIQISNPSYVRIAREGDTQLLRESERDTGHQEARAPSAS